VLGAVPNEARHEESCGIRGITSPRRACGILSGVGETALNPVCLPGRGHAEPDVGTPIKDGSWQASNMPASVTGCAVCGTGLARSCRLVAHSGLENSVHAGPGEPSWSVNGRRGAAVAFQSGIGPNSPNGYPPGHLPSVTMRPPESHPIYPPPIPSGRGSGKGAMEVRTSKPLVVEVLRAPAIIVVGR